jgi:hypothetical protein
MTLAEVRGALHARNDETPIYSDETSMSCQPKIEATDKHHYALYFSARRFAISDGILVMMIAARIAFASALPSISMGVR